MGAGCRWRWLLPSWSSLKKKCSEVVAAAGSAVNGHAHLSSLHHVFFLLQKLLEVFKEYAFLWQQDVNQTFEDFLSGLLTPNPLRTATAARADKQAPQPPAQTDRSSQASR